jgi:hypothetical protein
MVKQDRLVSFKKKAIILYWQSHFMERGVGFSQLGKQAAYNWTLQHQETIRIFTKVLYH